MYVISGATGRVGSQAALALLAAGAHVRVLVRREADATQWRQRGADAQIVGLDETNSLAAALQGATGFFTLLPFDLSVDDLDRHADALIASIAAAVRLARVPHVVMLSSGGADLTDGTGPITGLHRLEHALRATGTTLTALRSGHFQEKLSDVAEVAREHGVYPVFAASAEVERPMIATADLGHVVAESLLAPPAASENVDVLGPAYSESTVATLLAKALDQELTVALIPEEAWPSALADAGFRPHVAESLAELYRADEHGLLAPRGDRAVRGPTPIDDVIAHIVSGR